MRKKRGFTIVELTIGLIILSFTLVATFGLLLTGVKSCETTQRDVELSQPNAQALRRISETLRRASSLTIADGGNTIHYTLPKTTGGVDPVSGETEYVVPLQSDGVSRSFAVLSGSLVDRSTGRTLVRNVLSYDPDPQSSQYNKTYAPFTVTSIGSRRAITVNLITSQMVNRKRRYVRLKTSVLVQNIR